MAHHEYPKRLYPDGPKSGVTVHSAEEEADVLGTRAPVNPREAQVEPPQVEPKGAPEPGTRDHHRAAILDAFTVHIDGLSDEEMAEVFATIPSGSDEPPTEAPDQFDAMDDEALRAFLKDRDGKTPHHRTARPKLLDAARGDAAATAAVTPLRRPRRKPKPKSSPDQTV